ncbi:MAG: hypothetical protein EPO16_01070 [Dehalococcoidia bacterium]|nr:MAG: hypothetical protein EPO16_01070 [Dehalococcoidia bacterium]
MKYVVGFGKFWYDFIVGDSAVLAVGGAAVLIVGALLARGGASGLAQLALPALVVGTLALSLRGTR